jgi:dihydroorotate dehydrogenase electron transfer subunit
MRLVAAELVDSRQILPGQWLQSFHAPELASGSRAGQFVHVRTGDYSGLVLRRPFSINTADPATGIITLHFRTVGRGTEWLTRVREGERLDMLGPLGRPFEVDPRSRHLLLIAGGLGMAGVRMLTDEALRDGRQVTILFGALSANDVYPSSLLPDEVEYVVATDDGSLGHHGLVTELVPQYEAWADQAFACGPHPMLARLAVLAAGRRDRLGVAKLGRKKGGGKRDPLGSTAARRKAFLQVSMEQTMGCAVGACLGCIVIGVEGPLRVCREGPVFAAEEIAWPNA